ncbi:neurofilament heavy polypeptide-like [Venturia canescens]|uniref:neurofilament heavy polypeptide-like n=1 Tax=Venturia canescens TaxID=32260 RepID=UPI001C9C9401|nr:neurofilament heavy polypeptide-like [Venturia canescens]
MDKLDMVNAPQWADFDASVRSDIDEYFNVLHEDLEPEQLGDLQYHSCPGTPNGKNPNAESPYKTPKSDSSRSSQELSSYLQNLQTKGDKSLLKSKMSITPRTYVLKKACSRMTRSLSQQIDVDESAKSSETPKKDLTNVDQGNSEYCENMIKHMESSENSESMDNGEEEMYDHNRTLVATEESNKNLSEGCDFNDCNEICTQSLSEAIGKAEHCIVETKNSGTESVLEEPKDSVVPIVDSNSEIPKEISLSQEEPEKIQRANESKVKSVKLQSLANHRKPVILNNRKNPRSKPTVLTSHARRQSTSKYRRVSNKYISLAEAVSKFQNGTPERFRSANRKDGKGSNAPGPVQKVKKTALKVTCAISPVLRCKYRSRATSVPNQGECATLEVKEIHRNQTKSNPIKQLVPNNQKNLKTTSTVSELKTKLKKITIDDSIKIADKKLATDSEALKSTQTTTINNGPKVLKKMGELTKNDSNLSSRPKIAMNPQKIGEKVKKTSSIADPSPSLRRTMMNPPKIGESMKKSSSIADPPSSHKTMMNPPKTEAPIKKSSYIAGPLSSRRTMMNPPKAGEAMKKSLSSTDPLSSRRTLMNPPKGVPAPIKIEEPTKNSSVLSSDRETMMNPPKAPLQNSGKSTKMRAPAPLKVSLDPPAVVKKFDNELKPHAAESFLDKTSTENILSTTILTESMRKKTPCKKKVQTVISTDNGASIKDEEISHFGIPVGNAYKKITEAVPFNFESHKKQQGQMRKDPPRNRQNGEEKKTKTFHARPVPSYVINPSPNLPKHPSKPPVMADAPFSFQQRDENLLKKKKEMFDQMIEREKKNRVFHARPAPKFKPVFVRGASSENLRTNKAAETQTKLSSETRRRGLSQDAIADDRENTEPNIVANNQPFPKLKIPLTTTLNRKFKKIPVS